VVSRAAVGHVQLGRLPEFLDYRIRLARRYTEAIRSILGLEPPCVPDWARTKHHSDPVRVTPGFPLTRDQLMQALLDRGIGTRHGIMNAHQELAYAGGARVALPRSEAARDEVVLLPLYDALAEDGHRYVIDCLSELATMARGA
jgi:dTDP-4-amino-4,6-dideoxygalactose transaminase